ncbi:RNA polymerase sigma-70 factor [Taibaiella koreensis]|uniref:RNA polymerase sigma-70 factor n=1 Tax=Taibaiella koreensis TaxID=1268548 RepID=UPI0013C2A701|nr:RNA polymerase sigma-70 factor [Taibaiella koreensis]
MIHEAEIAQLFADHYESLHRYAFTLLKDEDEAKDAVQSVFLTIWEKKETIQINSSPKAYLFRSVYHECLNYIRKQDVLKKHHAHAVAGLEDSRQQPFAFEDALFIREKIDKVLQELPPQCREVFVKSRAEQKKYSEIAAELGIAVKTVEAHMSKALKLIRQVLRVFILLFCLYNDLPQL